MGNYPNIVIWDKPLQIRLKNGTFKVYNLGLGWKDKRLVQIEPMDARFPAHDGSTPNIFNPDNNGYVVEFDACIENVPEKMLLDVTDDRPVVIKRHGKIVYED